MSTLNQASKAKSKKPSSKKKSTPKKAAKKAEDSSDQSLSEDNESAKDVVKKVSVLCISRLGSSKPVCSLTVLFLVFKD